MRFHLFSLLTRDMPAVYVMYILIRCIHYSYLMVFTIAHLRIFT